jgi:hypothetical protein
MRVEIIILAITIFLIYNTYHNGKYTKMFFMYKKYYQMAGIALLGLSMWLLIRKNPSQCKNLLMYANNMVKYMPIDRNAMNMINPIMDFTDIQGGAMYQMNTSLRPNERPNERPNDMRILESGQTIPGKATKRSVSETKKKFVASQQNWKCANCHEQLNAWFEVDHKVRLEYGGSNHVENLVALCRECHGRKTAMENM